MIHYTEIYITIEDNHIHPLINILHHIILEH